MNHHMLKERNVQKMLIFRKETQNSTGIKYQKYQFHLLYPLNVEIWIIFETLKYFKVCFGGFCRKSHHQCTKSHLIDIFVSTTKSTQCNKREQFGKGKKNMATKSMTESLVALQMQQKKVFALHKSFKLMSQIHIEGEFQGFWTCVLFWFSSYWSNHKLRML